MGIQKNDDLSDIIKKVNLYLDNELPIEAHSQLLNDINSNPNYSQVLQGEKNFRNFLKTNITRQEPSDQFLQDLREKIKPFLS